VYAMVRWGTFVGDWMYGKRNRMACDGFAGRMERSARNWGVLW
jgi:hypothetical protein